MKRIDKLTPGAKVVLRFVGRWGNATQEGDFTFVGIRGTGDDRRAVFSEGVGDEWEAYRYEGRWAYGSSADPLQVVDNGELEQRLITERNAREREERAAQARHAHERALDLVSAALNGAYHIEIVQGGRISDGRTMITIFAAR